MPLQVASPEVKIQHISLQRMCLQVRNGLGRIVLIQLLLQIRACRPVVNDPGDHQKNDKGIESRGVVLKAVRRREIQNFGDNRRRNNSQQKQKTDVRQSAVKREQKQT